MLGGILQHLFCRRIPAQICKTDNGYRKGHSLLFEGRFQRITQLPVAVCLNLDRLSRSIPKIPGQLLFSGFLFNFCKDFYLFKGKIGKRCGLVFFPEVGKHVVVFTRTGQGCHSGDNSGNDCGDAFHIWLCFIRLPE